MNKEIIPTDLHFLIEMVEKWGLPDDGYRDEQLFNASIVELREITECLTAKEFEDLNTWLVDNADNKNLNMTNEYVNFTCFVMAYDMAQVLLDNKENNEQQ